MFALHGQHRDSHSGVSVCIPRVTYERPCTMSDMNYTSQQPDHLRTEIERLSLIESEIGLMRHHIFDIIERSFNIGDKVTVSTLYRLSEAFDESISFFHARAISLQFGDD